jgi:precorrin-3B methylase
MLADERHGDTEPRSAIDYIPGYNRYSDRVEEEEEDGEIENTRTGRTIEEGNRKLNNALPEMP